MILHLDLLLFALFCKFSFDPILVLLVIDFMLSESPLETASGDLIDKVTLVFQSLLLLG